MMTRMTLSAIVAALAVVLVSAAQATPPGDAHERQAVTTIAQDAHDRGAVQPTPTSRALVQDAHDRGTFAPRPVVVASGGFDWGDATIGALGGMGFALLLGGVVLLALAQRERTRLAIR